jgi:hypothetical protein
MNSRLFSVLDLKNGDGMEVSVFEIEFSSSTSNVSNIASSFSSVPSRLRMSVLWASIPMGHTLFADVETFDDLMAYQTCHTLRQTFSQLYCSD